MRLLEALNLEDEILSIRCDHSFLIRSNRNRNPVIEHLLPEAVDHQVLAGQDLVETDPELDRFEIAKIRPESQLPRPKLD